MDKQELLSILQELDARLTAACDIVLVGGAAMILRFGAGRATRDVDILVLRGDVGELRRAAKVVAQAHDLPEDWMNDAAKGFADVLPPDFYHRLALLDIPLQRLRMYVLGRADQAALKIVALREQDLEDLELLLPPMGDDERKTLVAIMHHVSAFRPDWAYKMKLFLQEQGWPIE